MNFNYVNSFFFHLRSNFICLQETVIQGFVPPGRIKKFMPHMRQGGLYTLTNFYGFRNKEVFRVAAHSVTISFSHTSELVPLENIPWTSRRTVSGSIPMKTSKLAVIWKVIFTVSFLSFSNMLLPHTWFVILYTISHN